jgi:hypothetical protein
MSLASSGWKNYAKQNISVKAGSKQSIFTKGLCYLSPAAIYTMHPTVHIIVAVILARIDPLLGKDLDSNKMRNVACIAVYMQ